MKDNKLLAEIGSLAILIQKGQVPGSNIRIYYTARIIEWLAEIVRFHDTNTVHAFLKWLDTDEEREYYKKIIY